MRVGEVNREDDGVASQELDTPIATRGRPCPMASRPWSRDLLGPWRVP